MENTANGVVDRAGGYLDAIAGGNPAIALLLLLLIAYAIYVTWDRDRVRREFLQASKDTNDLLTSLANTMDQQKTLLMEAVFRRGGE